MSKRDREHIHFTHGTVEDAIRESKEREPEDLPEGLSDAGAIVTHFAGAVRATLNADVVVMLAMQGENAACAHVGARPTPDLIATLRRLADDLEKQVH